MSVRWRLTVIATAVFAVAMAAGAFFLVSTVRDKLETSIKQTTEEQLNAVAAQLQGGKSPEEVGLPSAQLRNHDGRLEPEVQVYPQFARGPGDVYVAERRVGDLVLVAQRSFDEVNSTINNLKTILFVAVPLLVLLVGYAVWYFTGRALRPVEAIRTEAEEITGTTIHRRVPEPDTDDEVGRLARTMNAMLGRLEESSQRQRQFVSDASHELRSPLTSMRANLEVALRNPDRSDWPSVARRVLAEDERMEDTVSELLEMARLDESANGAALGQLPEVDLDELVHDETVREHRTLINTVRVSGGRVHGRREQLARVVRNLVDNADRHARTQVAVELHDDAETGTVELIVDDDGPGIPVEDRERVFDRFTRLDDGRARDAGGLGLGLSMVKAIVEQHGGTVIIGDAPLGGARVTVTLPAA
jgi:signal transduction histidine kinase